MPITDGVFTDAELISAIEAKPELISVVSTALNSSNHGKKFMSDFESAAISKHTKEFATKLEEDVRSLTGIEKASADEKYYDYNKRALDSLKKEAHAAKEEANALKGKSNITAEERQQLEAAKASLAESNKKIADLESGHKSEIVRLKAGNQILNEVAPIRSTFVKGQQGVEKAVELLHAATLEKMTASAKISDDTGQLIFIGKDGKALLNQDSSFKTASQIYSEEMADFIDKGKKGAGAGGNDPNQNPVNMPQGVKTRGELIDYLRSKGFAKNTKEFTAEYDKLSKNLPLA